MFDFVTKYTFSWPVKVITPQADGTTTEGTFTASWEAQDTRELNAFQAEHPKGSIYALLEKALKSVDGLNDGGKPMALTPDNLDRIVATPNVSAALVASYWDAVSGKLREKN